MPSDQSTTVWAGRYSDGKTAGSVPADVRLTDRGIVIGFPGAPSALVWPYRALGIGTPIAKTAADALLTYSYMPGATLFVSDAAFVRGLVKAAPQLTLRAHGWRSAKPWLFAAALVALAAAGIWAASLSPATTLARMMPDNVRRTIGEQVIASMGSGKRVCDGKDGVAALDRLVARLSAASGTTARFDVKVIDWNLVNAFAVPGEQIVLTREIIQKASSPDEVAGVLAHEMGHGIELHPESSVIRAIGLSAALEIMMGGSGGTIGNIGLLLTQNSYTRSAERQADKRGLELLERAQISPLGVVAFFDRMAAAERNQGAPGWDLLRTHPQSDQRARIARDRAGYKATPALSAEDWQALRNICGTAKR